MLGWSHVYLKALCVARMCYLYSLSFSFFQIEHGYKKTYWVLGGLEGNNSE